MDARHRPHQLSGEREVEIVHAGDGGDPERVGHEAAAKRRQVREVNPTSPRGKPCRRQRGLDQLHGDSRQRRRIRPDIGFTRPVDIPDAFVEHALAGIWRAIGRSADLDPGLAAGLLSQARLAITDAYRGPGGQALFGPRCPAGQGITTIFLPGEEACSSHGCVASSSE